MDEKYINMPVEERGKLASKEIADILSKYGLLLAVDINGAQDFINSLKPTLVENKDVKKSND